MIFTNRSKYLSGAILSISTITYIIYKKYSYLDAKASVTNNKKVVPYSITAIPPPLTRQNGFNYGRNLNNALNFTIK